MPSFHLSRSCMVLQALCLESTGGVLSSISQLLMSCRMAKWWRFAGKLLVIHGIHAYKQHKILSQTNSISNCVLHVQKVVCLHCANKKLETYHTIWHNKCHIWRILRLRLVSFTLQRPSEDPNWTASTPDRKPARPTCKDSTTSFGLTRRPSRSNQQTTVRLLYPRYMYINLLCIVCSLYIFIGCSHVLVIIYINCLPELLSFCTKKSDSFQVEMCRLEKSPRSWAPFSRCLL